VREYSKPRPRELGSVRVVGAPGEAWTNVAARLMGTKTAPVGLDSLCSRWGLCRKVVPVP